MDDDYEFKVDYFQKGITMDAEGSNKSEDDVLGFEIGKHSEKTKTKSQTQSRIYLYEKPVVNHEHNNPAVLLRYPHERTKIGLSSTL